MRALVTGGAGLIGSHIVDILLNKGYEVRVLDNLEPQTHPNGRPAWISPEVDFIHGDVRDPDAVRRALRDVDVVFHEAAFGGFTSELSRYVEANSLGTVRLFEVIRSEGISIQKVVVASSQAVYGEGTYRCPTHGQQYPKRRPLERLRSGRWEVPCPLCGDDLEGVPTAEDKRQDGESIYALTKASQERWSLALGKQLGIPVVALRYGVTFGPRQSIHNPYTGIISIFSTRMLNDLSPIIYEDGQQMRDLIFVEDVAAANVFVMEHAEANDQIFNVANGRGVRIVDVVQTLATTYGRSAEILLPGEFRPLDVRHIVLDTAKLTALGWQPRVSLRQGIERYTGWIRSLGPVKDYVPAAHDILRQNGVVLASQPANAAQF